MDLINCFKTECVKAGSTAADKASLLREISALAVQVPELNNITKETIFTNLHGREQLGSTGFQNGIAIPHCLLPEVKGFVVGLITHKEGVDFKSMDGKPARIFPFIIGPKTQRNDHIRLLSAISRILHDKNVPAELLAAKNPQVLSENFLRHIGGSLQQEKTARRNLIVVSVQDENLFEDILQIFSEHDDTFLSVLDAHDCAEYLGKLPLFAAFWNEDKKGFHRVLLASVKHALANELIRRLDTLVGGMDKKKGVLVQMMDTLYTAGSLEI